jgi:hypothetical protein
MPRLDPERRLLQETLRPTLPAPSPAGAAREQAHRVVAAGPAAALPVRECRRRCGVPSCRWRWRRVRTSERRTRASGRGDGNDCHRARPGAEEALRDALTRRREPVGRPLDEPPLTQGDHGLPHCQPGHPERLANSPAHPPGAMRSGGEVEHPQHRPHPGPEPVGLAAALGERADQARRDRPHGLILHPPGAYHRDEQRRITETKPGPPVYHRGHFVSPSASVSSRKTGGPREDTR